MFKLCIITTQDSSIKNWFEPIFNIYKNDKFKVTFVTKFSQSYFDYLKKTYPEFCFINCPFPRGTNIRSTIKSIKFLKILFKKEKFDLVEYHTPNASFCASIAAKKTKIKNRLYGQWGLRFVSFGGIKRFFFKLIEKITCSKSTIVHAQSNKNMEININQKICNKNKISVLGIGGTIGVDFHIFDYSKRAEFRHEIRSKYNIASDEFVYGFIGRIHRDKGVDNLVEAFKEIKGSKLVVVGDQDKNYPILPKNMKYLRDSENIILINRVEREDVAKFLASFDLFVYPTYREGFGHILQEAMTMGTPVLTSDVPGPSEVVENNVSGLLIDPKNKNEIVSKMLYLKNNKKLLDSFSLNGRERAVKYFETSVMVSYIKEDYEKIFGVKIYGC